MTLNPTRPVTPLNVRRTGDVTTGGWAVGEGGRGGGGFRAFAQITEKNEFGAPRGRARAVLAIDDDAIAACATCALSLRSAPFELLLQKGRSINRTRFDLISSRWQLGEMSGEQGGERK